MTNEQRTKFINDLITNVRAKILENAGKMPDEWDGIELRTYISDTFRDSCLVAMERHRKHDYENEVLIRNL